MRRGIGLLVLLAVAGCAPPGAPQRSSSDVDQDRTAVAQALRAADASGMAFQLTGTIVYTGGSIPQGQEARIGIQASGVERSGAVRMTSRITLGRNPATSYDVVLSGAEIFIKPHSSSQWNRTDIFAANTLYPSLRLPLLRETVLLARNVGSGSVANVNNGLARRYAVTPASDQLEELQSAQLMGQAEQAFLKTASGEVDAFVGLTGGGKLTRVEVHLKGTDPSDGQLQAIDSTADFSSSPVGAITPPADSTPVAPSALLTPGG